MSIHYLLVSAITPAALMVWYFYARDLNKEPMRWLWITFFLGALSVIPAGLTEIYVTPLVGKIEDPYIGGLAQGLLNFALREEFLKYLVLLLFVIRLRAFDEPMDGMVYGAVAALGFAAIENIDYVFRYFESYPNIALFRAFTAVPLHASVGAMMGYFVGQARFSGRSKWLLLLGFAWAVLVHGLYDAPWFVMQALGKQRRLTADISGWLFLGGMGVLLISVVVTFRAIRRLRREQLTLAEQAKTTASTGFAPIPTAALSISSTDTSRQPVSGSKMVSWFLLVLGGLLATAGGIVVLALASTAILEPHKIEWGALVFGTLLMGLPPLGLGLFLFSYALKRMRKAKKEAA